MLGMVARFPALLCITFAAWLSWVSSQAQTPAPEHTESTFTNPLLDSGPDPWVMSRDGWYYYMNTTAVNLTIRKTRDITDLRHAETKVVWKPPASGPLAISLLTQSDELSTAPGGKSNSSQLSPICFPGGSGLPSTVSIFRPPHIFSTNRGRNFNGYKAIRCGGSYKKKAGPMRGPPVGR